MTETDAVEMQQLATFARRRAANARGLADDRRRRAATALAARQHAYAQGLLDSACWLECAAEVEDRKAAMLDHAHRAAASRPRTSPRGSGGGGR